MRTLHADLHIHTCLSPCAEREMCPSLVARQALDRGLDVIAICDHNSAENAAAVSRAAEPVGLAVIRGMEVTSREEVHVLGLFDDERSLEAVQDVVHDHLPGENDPDTFGDQLVMDEHDQVVGSSPRLLIGATTLTLHEVVRTIHELGGIAIASHVDRPSFSVISQLGFIPEGLELDLKEIQGPTGAAERQVLLTRFTVVSSDPGLGRAELDCLSQKPDSEVFFQGPVVLKFS